MTETGGIAARHGRRPFLPSRQAVKRTGLGLMLAGGTALASHLGFHYWTVGRYLQSTDDAYVQADYTTVAPKVSGYIADVLVEDNQRVAADTVLAHIDDRDFRTALDQAKAEVAAAEAALHNLDAQLALQQSVIAQQQATIASAEASLKFAQQDHARYHQLMLAGAGSVQRFQHAQATLNENVAGLQRDRAGLLAAQKKLDVLSTERRQAEAQRDRMRALERQAELNLSYTVITAPVDGTVGARALRVGQYVQSGTQLMAVVPLHAVFVVANFKETQLAAMCAGQPAEIAVDSFPGVKLKGHVDSLSPASGLQFALLPPDNATGNFTKIVQRIPVKIVLDDGALMGRLRPGMSVEPSVDTKAAAQAGTCAPLAAPEGHAGAPSSSPAG